LLPPLGGEFALKGVFEYGLAVDFELFPRLLQCGHAVVKVAEEFFDFGNDAVLLGQRGDWKIIIPQ